MSLSAHGLSEPVRAVLRALEGLACARACRLFIKAPPVTCLARTLYRSSRPVGFIVAMFLVVNWLLATVYYYCEPCYVSPLSVPLPSSYSLEGYAEGLGSVLGNEADTGAALSGVAACPFPTLFDAFSFSVAVTSMVGYPVGTPRTLAGQIGESLFC